MRPKDVKRDIIEKWVYFKMTNRFVRWVNAIYAVTFGYFWLPCPLCGRMYGAHEWKVFYNNPDEIFIDNDHTIGTGICPLCTIKGKGKRRYIR